MIRRRRSVDPQTDSIEVRGFDAYDLKLGDLMRGERATIGKSLLDVERDIRIRAAYIAAIENADPGVFDTPGFIPGYVRSYARYLGMDPDRTFRQFCDESGFSVTHGMAAGISGRHKAGDASGGAVTRANNDPIAAPVTPFLPERESMLSRIEPGAVGSALVLVGLIAAIGYGGWSVLREIQQVQVAPAENAPEVLSDLDPLDGVMSARAGGDDAARGAGLMPGPDAGQEALDRLYRPEPLDVPVMVARDGPISTLDPGEVGTFRRELVETADRASIDAAIASAVSGGDPAGDRGVTPPPKVVADPPPQVRLVAVRPAWIRVRAGDGSVLFEGILNGGMNYEVPAAEATPTLRVGASGSVYFEVDGRHYGPVGPRGAVTSGVVLSAEAVRDGYAVADITQDRDLSRYVAELDPASAARE